MIRKSTIFQHPSWFVYIWLSFSNIIFKELAQLCVLMTRFLKILPSYMEQAAPEGSLAEALLPPLRVLLSENHSAVTVTCWFLSSPFSLLLVVTKLVFHCMLILHIMGKRYHRNAETTLLGLWVVSIKFGKWLGTPRILRQRNKK